MSLFARRLAGIGLLVGIALAILLGITKPNPVAKNYTYWAVFDTAHGMGAIDRDVRIGGVKVGEVGQVERDGDDVRVELKLSEDYPLHADARAAMRPHTLFEGSNFVDLETGSPGAEGLKQGGEIPRDQTTNYVTLDKALRVLRPEIRNDLRHLAEVGAETLQGQAISGIQETLRKAPAMSRALAPAARAAQGPHRRELTGAIRGFAKTADALAGEQEDFVPLLQHTDRTAAALATDGGAPLDAALAELPGTLQALYDDAPALDQSVRRLASFSSQLGPSAPRAIARSLRATTPVLTKASPVLRDGTPVVHNARLIGSRLAEAKGGLTTMFKVLASPLKTFPGTLAALNAPTTLGASSGALQLVAGAFEGLDGAVASYHTKAQSPAQPGHQLRGDLYLEPNSLSNALAQLLGGGASLGPRAGSCAEVQKVSPRAVGAVKAHGGCR